MIFQSAQIKTARFYHTFPARTYDAVEPHKPRGGMDMSFYSYKNANPDCCPGRVSSDSQTCVSEKVCVHVKKVYDFP